LAYIANAISFADRAFAKVAICPTIKDADVMHVNMREDEKTDLMIPDAVLEKLGMFEYAPTWLRNRLNGVPCPSADQVLNARAVLDCQQFVGFMAMYGRQHLISDDLLRSKGLQTVLCRDQQGLRLISPWEMIAAMGYEAEVVLASDMSEAWKMAGNGLTVAHAWLQMHKSHVMMGGKSPFTPNAQPLRQIASLQKQAIKMSKYQSVVEGEMMQLQEVCLHPVAKKPRVEAHMCEPTVPFTVEDSDDSCTKAFPKEPVFEQIQDPRKFAVAGNAYGDGLVIFQHDQKNWMMIINTPSEEVVANVVQRALPHAKHRHFQKFMFGDVEVCWEQLIKCKPMQTLSFCPVFTDVLCEEQSLNIALTLKVDVTWTTRSTIAFAAVRMGCNPEALAVTCNELVMKEDDFLLEYERTDFKLKFKACMPGYVNWSPKESVAADPGMAPAHRNMIRWFARHPARKTIRTVPAIARDTVENLVQAMFPDLHATTSWTAFHDQTEVAGKDQANQWPCLTIQWNGFRPLQTTKLVAMPGASVASSPAQQVRNVSEGIQRHVRSPFQVKSTPMWMKGDSLVGEIAASFLTVAQLQVSMLAMQGSMVIDPMMKINETAEDEVLSFRICPLLGGMKVDVKTRITNMLVARGVPKEKVDDRVKDLISKVPIEKFKNNLPDDAFWVQVKTCASEAKFRLISLDELKAFQNANRKGKDKPAASSKDVEKKAEPFLADANKMVIDASHFSADGKDVSLLETTRFGPDQTGVCVVNPEDAKMWINQGVKSCDPLALFVVGKGSQNFGEVFSVPAHTTNGLPVIVQGSLVQFGDVPIQFNLKIPSVVVEQVASTTIEFVICRDQVANWADVAVPLHYIGVHIPELRGSNLLATWSIKAWEKQKPVHHTSADHWHGFFRIADAMLYAVLTRSGNARIFLNPKTPDRRHDPRFVTISLPSGKLTDVLARADSCPKAVGVAKRGEIYCIRCKREDADQLRAQLMPESAYVETASFSDDETLYSLTNVPQVNRDELSSALAKAGWDANAIKPQGWKRWIVAAKQPPPAHHVGINGTIVVVEKVNKAGNAMQPVTMFAREYKVDTIRDQKKNNVVQVSTSSRIAEFKAQMDDQITAVVEQKMAAAQVQISQLQHALQEVKASNDLAQQSIAVDMEQVKQEQSFTRQKLQEVVSSVSTSGQAIIQQMQSMFTSMQANLEMRLQQNLASDADKRPRVDGPGSRADPFANKS
jgi:hypothetical protein